MRITFALKNLLTPMLTLFLLAGCVAPMSAPEGIAARGADTVTLSVSLAEGNYRTQHLESEIESLVFGLVDVSNEPYFGLANGDAFTAAATSYHEVIAGSAGLLTNLKDPDTLIALGESDRGREARFLYRTGGTTARKVSFGNIKPTSKKRFVAFVAAFNKDVALGVTKENAIGFVQSEPFSVGGDGVPSESLQMSMALNRELAKLQVKLTLKQPANLASMSHIVVGVVDANEDANWTPSLGYGATPTTLFPLDANGSPAYHRAIAEGDGAPPLFDFLKTNLTDAVQQRRQSRYFYFIMTPADFGAQVEKEILFSNLRPGGTYHTFAAAFQGGAFAAVNERGYIQSDGAIPLSANDTRPSPLELTLEN